MADGSNPFLDQYGGDGAPSPAAQQAQQAQPAAPAQHTNDFLTQYGGEKPEPPPELKYGQAATALRHGVHGATSGWDDELAGLAAASGFPHMPKGIPQMIGLARMGYEKLMGGDQSAHERYTAARDKYRQELQESAAEYPKTALASDIGGSMVVPGGSAMKAEGFLPRLWRGAIVSGEQGAIRGAGEAKETEDIPQGMGTGFVSGAVLGGPLNAVLGPSGAPAANQEVIDLANKYGVQLPRYMTSESPILQSLGVHLGHLPFVGDQLGASTKRAVQGVEDIRTGELEHAFGTPDVSPTEARTMASTAATKAREDFVTASKQNSSQNYDAVVNAMNDPDAKEFPMYLATETLKQLDRARAYGGTGGSLLQQAYEAIRNPEGLTYQALKDLRTNLNTRWHSMEDKGGLDFANYAGLLQNITKDMEYTVHQQGGPGAVALWEKANAQHAAGMDMKDYLTTAVSKAATKDQAPPTAAADAIFRNINQTRPNIPAIARLRAVMNPNSPAWDQVRAGTLARMGADDAGNFSIQKLISADAKLSDAGRNSVFGYPGSPTREKYDAIIKIGQAIQKVESRYTNWSKTAYAAGTLGTLYELYQDPWQTGKEMAGGALLGAILSRRTTGVPVSRFANAFSRYAANPAMVVAGKVPRALSVAGRNLAISLTNQQQGQQ